MRVTIHQPQFLPWLGYLDKIDRADLFIVLDTVQFKKNEWQNRNRIRTAMGWQWLTVPVLQHFGQRIDDVLINPTAAWRAGTGLAPRPDLRPRVTMEATSGVRVRLREGASPIAQPAAGLVRRIASAAANASWAIAMATKTTPEAGHHR